MWDKESRVCAVQDEVQHVSGCSWSGCSAHSYSYSLFGLFGRSRLLEFFQRQTHEIFRRIFFCLMKLIVWVFWERTHVSRVLSSPVQLSVHTHTNPPIDLTHYKFNLFIKIPFLWNKALKKLRKHTKKMLVVIVIDYELWKS